MSYQPEKIVVEGKEVNYYEFLQLADYQPGNSTGQILGKSELSKAYRSRALAYHPDKNPGDEIAAQLFLQLKKVYDVLTDSEKRGEYDRYIQSVNAKRQRFREMDGARKKARDDLLQREKEARDMREREVQESARYETELDRLRKGTEYARPQAPRRSPSPQRAPPTEPIISDPRTLLQKRLSHLESQLTHSDTTVKIRWKRKTHSFAAESLTEIFADYGTIEHVLPSSKKPGTALVLFSSVIGPHAAMKAWKSGSEKLSPFELSWANPSHSEPPVVSEILKIMDELANTTVPTPSNKPKRFVQPSDYKATYKMTLEQFEAWTMARVQVFDQARFGTV